MYAAVPKKQCVILTTFIVNNQLLTNSFNSGINRIAPIILYLSVFPVLIRVVVKV